MSWEGCLVFVIRGGWDRLGFNQSVMSDEELILLCDGTGMYKLPETIDYVREDIGRVCIVWV